MLRFAGQSFRLRHSISQQEAGAARAAATREAVADVG